MKIVRRMREEEERGEAEKAQKIERKEKEEQLPIRDFSHLPLPSMAQAPALPCLHWDFGQWAVGIGAVPLSLSV